MGLSIVVHQIVLQSFITAKKSPEICTIKIKIFQQINTTRKLQIYKPEYEV